MSDISIDPKWLERQVARFQPSDLDEAVRIMRGYARADRDEARRQQMQKVS